MGFPMGETSRGDSTTGRESEKVFPFSKDSLLGNVGWVFNMIGIFFGVGDTAGRGLLSGVGLEGARVS